MTGDEILASVLDALNIAGVRHMLVGSFSTNLYGIPRSTQDADVVVQMSDDEAARFRASLPALMIRATTTGANVGARYLRANGRGRDYHEGAMAGARPSPEGFGRRAKRDRRAG
jgi:hypothetical protein